MLKMWSSTTQKVTRPFLTYSVAVEDRRIECNYIAGLRRVSWGKPPKKFPQMYDANTKKTYPFGWLGILSEIPPVEH